MPSRRLRLSPEARVHSERVRGARRPPAQDLPPVSPDLHVVVRSLADLRPAEGGRSTYHRSILRACESAAGLYPNGRRGRFIPRRVDGSERVGVDVSVEQTCVFEALRATAVDDRRPAPDHDAKEIRVGRVVPDQEHAMIPGAGAQQRHPGGGNRDRPRAKRRRAEFPAGSIARTPKVCAPSPRPE